MRDDDIDNNITPELTRPEALQAKQEQELRALERKQKLSVANDYAGTLRDRQKKAFAFAYAAYKFGTGEKFWWGGKVVAWDEVWIQVPARIRKEVYKKINAIEGGQS